jgi:hypothetical protein
MLPTKRKLWGSLKAKGVLALFLFAPLSHISTLTAQTAGAFAPTGDMNTGRILHTATLLADGRVLIAGGVIGSYPSITATAELYDPRTGMFTATGEMTTARRSHTATLLPDGRVLIAGGHGLVSLAAVCQPSSCGELASAELYDPATGTFARTGDMIAGGNASGGAKPSCSRTARYSSP